MMLLWAPERRVDRIGYSDLQKRIAIGEDLHNGFSRNIAGGSRSIFDYKLLPEPFGQRLSKQSSDYLGWPARGKAGS